MTSLTGSPSGPLMPHAGQEPRRRTRRRRPTEAYRRDVEGRACRVTEAVGIRSISYPFDGLFHLAKGPFG